MVTGVPMPERVCIRRRVSLLVVACAGTGIAILAFGMLRRWEEARVRNDLRDVTEAHAFALQRALDRHAVVLESVAGFHASSEEVTREEFHTFAAVFLKRYPDIRALEWAPLVGEEARAAFENRARGEGLTDFQITERTAAGEIVRAGPRGEYFPVFFVEPVEGNEVALGFDLGSEPERAASLARARDTGQLAASGPITIVQDPICSCGYLLIMPLYRKGMSIDSIEARHDRIEGFVLGVGSVEGVVNRALGGRGTGGVDLYVADAGGAGGEQLLFGRTAAGQTVGGERPVDVPNLRAGRHHIAMLNLGDRKWQVLCTPGAGFAASRRTWQPWIALVAGAAITVLLAVHILAVLGAAAQAGRFAAAQARSREEIERAFEEQKRAEAESSHLRNLLSNVVNSMPSVLIGVDPEGRVTQWNRGASEAAGLDAAGAVGRTLSDVFPALAAEMEKVREAIRSREAQRDTKVPREVGGELHYEDVTVYPLIANGVEGAVIRVDDVTDRVRLEEMVIQSEKMLSVGGLAAGMAHEINNPLSGILQNAAVLANRLTGDLPGNRKAAEDAGTSMEGIRAFMEERGVPQMLKNLRDSGERAAHVVQNMLSFARKSESSCAPHDVARLLDGAVELAENDYDLKKNYDFRHIEIVREYAADVPEVPCEETKLQQVFLNLLKNGAHAMSERVERDKTQGLSPARPRFVLRVARHEGFVCVEIEDNGPGMPEAVRRRIFEPFFTTKGPGTGMGLGLSVSYFIIAENHRGTMNVESRPGEGCRFTIRLPLRRSG